MVELVNGMNKDIKTQNCLSIDVFNYNENGRDSRDSDKKKDGLYCPSVDLLVKGVIMAQDKKE